MVRLLCILILLTLDCTVVLCSFVSLLHYLANQPSRLQGCSNKISCQLSVVTDSGSKESKYIRGREIGYEQKKAKRQHL